MNLRIESAAIDSLMVRLFDQIDEANMPWLITAAENLRAAFGAQLIDLVPSYTTLLLHYDLHALSEADAIALIHSSLHNLQPLANETGTLHALPVWYHESVGPELTSIAQRAGLTPEQVIEQHCSRDYPVLAREPMLLAPRSRCCWHRLARQAPPLRRAARWSRDE